MQAADLSSLLLLLLFPHRRIVNIITVRRGGNLDRCKTTSSPRRSPPYVVRARMRSAVTDLLTRHFVLQNRPRPGSHANGAVNPRDRMLISPSSLPLSRPFLSCAFSLSLARSLPPGSPLVYPLMARPATPSRRAAFANIVARRGCRSFKGNGR